MDHNTKKTTWVRPEVKGEPPQAPSPSSSSGQPQQARCFNTQCVLFTTILRTLVASAVPSV